MGYGHRRSLVPPIREVLIQVQEKMTAKIAKCLNSVLKPHGVGVVVKATQNADERGAQAGRQDGNELFAGNIQDTTGNVRNFFLPLI